tara:strand:- start:3193 stop:3888 length:696 start_codon:yes stop_codon:yes gene_type:complete
MLNKKITVVICNIKKKSKRLRNKNFIKIYNVPLYQITLNKLLKCKFDKVYVDTDSEEIKRYCKKKKINIINRIPFLATDRANGNHLMNYHRKIIKADIYFHIHVTSPLLKVKTINKCIKFLQKTKKFHSIITTKSQQGYFWFKGKPINYNPKIFPRSQDLSPMIYETTALYGVKKNVLDKYKFRIGKKPYFHEVDDFEKTDLDTKKDLDYLEYLIKNDRNLKKKRKEYLNF